MKMNKKLLKPILKDDWSVLYVSDSTGMLFEIRSLFFPKTSLFLIKNLFVFIVFFSAQNTLLFLKSFKVVLILFFSDSMDFEKFFLIFDFVFGDFQQFLNRNLSVWLPMPCFFIALFFNDQTVFLKRLNAVESCL